MKQIARLLNSKGGQSTFEYAALALIILSLFVFFNSDNPIRGAFEDAFQKVVDIVPTE